MWPRDPITQRRFHPSCPLPPPCSKCSFLHPDLLLGSVLMHGITGSPTWLSAGTVSPGCPAASRSVGAGSGLHSQLGGKAQGPAKATQECEDWGSRGERGKEADWQGLRESLGGRLEAPI